MSHIQVFDPALCCGTGVRGTDVEQARVTFAATPAVLALLGRSGPRALPAVLMDGEVTMTGRYPTRDELAGWAGLTVVHPVSSSGASCCSGSEHG